MVDVQCFAIAVVVVSKFGAPRGTDIWMRNMRARVRPFHCLKTVAKRNFF